ncbi:MAG TPA: hypothetical protein VFR34_00465 [Paracoccaceae bacterium]|nr:hypothetical protein [Paracoccaceae bacterium]
MDDILNVIRERARERFPTAEIVDVEAERDYDSDGDPMFHELAEDCGSLVMTKAARQETRHAWAQLYRSLSHERVTKACRPQNSRMKRAFERFPSSIWEFAESFCVLQERRIAADYDPLLPALTRAEVASFVDEAEGAIALPRKATAEYSPCSSFSTSGPDAPAQYTMIALSPPSQLKNRRARTR